MHDQLALLAAGLVNTFEPLNMLMIITGLTIGILAGALPGITMLNAIVLVLPFTYLMGIVPSLLLMTSVYCGGVFGGSITGILFNIPGDPMNVPTTWEGYQLNKKGFVSKALGMAIMCSAIGGFLSALIMTFVSPPFAKVALSFSSCEYFAVVFLGLVSVVVIGTKSLGSALISLFIGMVLATVGMDDIYGAVRFTFGSRVMETGINFTTVLIGLFAIGEVLDQLSLKNKGEADIARTRPKTSLPGFRDLWPLRYTMLRGLGIGTVIGAIPGTGATVSSFVSYGVEKQVSKTPEKFGTGCWEGLAASETSINASTGGAMIPLLTLGIPGSGATAVMMGAFLLHGIQPGPLLFNKSPESVYTIFVGMLICNLIMILAGVVTAKFFSELMRVPENILCAFIITFCFLGAFALRNDMADVWFMAIFGITGFFMRRYGLPIPPMILGIILGPLTEKYFMTTMIGAGNDFTIFFRRPISACLMVISIGLLIMPILRNLGKKEKKKAVAA
ncbi:MAG TPA: tripartite tricarboxylate transporter permease [Thermodesulfobacteriota bacterium]|nr:tripartite tricarboxylate transporter permease [Thermodesulfobacteriota bacterium]